MTAPVSQDVLSTLNEDGTRRWIHPRLARGRFLRRRRIVGYSLIALFVALPFIQINGRPAFLLDLVTRELSILGAVFRPTDGVILMLLGLTVVITVFFVTALFGRVWCGWGCPQSVYLELVFRPIEQWLEGSPAQRDRRRRDGTLRWRRLVKWMIYVPLAFVLANVFLAYFVGVARLEHWVIGSPADHVGGFGVVLAVTALVLFDFGYFREQACILACPYGRLQTVLLDRQSLIIGYDATRGEPRGKPKQRLPVVGDCVDCGACVAVCPTGIDIRNGLQMECIGCAQCIDACDAVMDKVHKPRGLIGYTSKDQLAGLAKHLVRMRTILYPILLVVVASLFGWMVGTRVATEITIGRITGPSFVALPDGSISSAVRVKVENESDATRRYTISLRDTPDGQLRNPQPVWEVRARKSVEIPLFVDVPRASFANGQRRAYLAIDDDAGFHRIVTVTLVGPEGENP